MIFNEPPIDLLRLSSRTYNALVRHKVYFISDLKKSYWQGAKGIGVSRAQEISRKLQEYYSNL